MKKYSINIFTTLLTVVLITCLTSCTSDNDNDEFVYPIEKLYGTWRISHYKLSENGTYVMWPKQETTATFYSNGTYSGKGYFGNGSGTYIAKGKTITTYVDWKVYLVYDVLSLVSYSQSNQIIELKMSKPGADEVLWIKCVKRQ